MPNDDTTYDESGVVTKASPRSVPDTVARLKEILSSGGVELFDVIDQSDEARQVGLQLRATILVIFGSPTAGTPVMVASPLSALDLPLLKVLVWADDGRTNVSYHDPKALAVRHHLSADLAGNRASIDILTDRLIAP